MVTSEEEIARRLQERDSERSARRAQVATTVGELARRHAELAGQLADLERELGEVLTAAGEVIDVPELAQVTDVPVDDLTRWRDQAAKPARGGKRKRPSAKKNDAPGKGTQAATATRATRPVAPASAAPAPESVADGVAVGAASS
ncbi:MULTISPECIES: hypothetical protein [Amycolatopsis]|uniref:Uncharacterized protein n=2 Tax=Amycolatopsis TaxID=1813 RepID=A0A2N3WEZ6_9PSEU|nr:MULTISPECIES: hypothetical protein [Amycolatopsis]MBB2505450.1 hypothetical protein [Amycolatopsis echigonensis]PKV92466.1 hypothetical protein ATK30_3270 [Amycolatopsis niigatensis]TVT20327.1 hypothetical protein FNH06_21270 [Amycolatopsis acidiphila]UIJ59652.1 hypothetical protein LWP59_37480 [Amycolatopsis acidiphila]GHG81119.1 hypothetical protein GCM10017788_50790 [Amycolatopsis acidiphila]